MYPHRIRLRGPWELTPVGERPRRATVPCHLADPEEAKTSARLTRKFGYPGRIDADERVWLTLSHLKGSASLTLNGQLLGQVNDGPFEHDITALLRPHNSLEILVSGGEVGEVALEVRATAFLQGVKAWFVGDSLHVGGVVAGTCERPLELYALVDGRHSFYRSISAGEAFEAALEKGRIVRLELVSVSTVWHAVEFDTESITADAPARPVDSH
jgi:hypothetical protein